ncbi:MAG: tRNA pseudouridine(38-40) synthase TruA [Acidimicrobiia bacterium]
MRDRMLNYKATIAYDGTNFHGVAEQLNGPDEPNIRTVIGELRAIINLVTQHDPKIIVSGRTDKGVHALNQVISFDLPENIDEKELSRLAYVCNSKLNPEILVKSIERVDENFHARFSAKSRTYRFFIDNSELPNIFNSRFSWHISKPLDIEAMKLAAKVFIGEQDFTSVCKKDESMPHNIREVFTSHFIEDEIFGDETICYEISANAFCWNMVRSIVGVLVDVGLGKISADEVPELLARKQRDSSRSFAPPQGLVLFEVAY